jgi:acyl-CoA dehydrogenase
MRTALNDALDIHGGRGVCDGPRNYLFGVYQSVPVAITVEGANILTRNLMIFGQGALRCHPHLLKEMEAARLPDPEASMQAFDKELWRHIRDAASNTFRSFWHNLTFGIFAPAPELPGIGQMYQQLHVLSVTFAAVADLVMATLGGELKRRESLSARLGDVLSELYLMSCTLKRFEDDGLPPADLPFVEWNYRTATYNIQKSLDEVLQNLPLRPVAFLLRGIAFPWGRYRRPPKVSVEHACATLMMAPGETRERLTHGIYISRVNNDATGRMEAAFAASVERDAIEDKIRKASKSGRKLVADLAALTQDGIITPSEADTLKWAHGVIRDAIDVDDFAASELTQRKTHTWRDVAAE